jgi:hypothetical protein
VLSTKLSFSESDVDASPPSSGLPVANPKVTTAPPAAAPKAPYPPAAAGCSVGGVTYANCASIQIGAPPS